MRSPRYNCWYLFLCVHPKGEIEILVKSTTALESARRRKLFASSLSSDGKNVETHIRRGSVIEFDLEKDDFEKEEDEPVKSESVQELKLEDLLDEDQVFFDETTPASLEHLKEVYEEKLEKRSSFLIHVRYLIPFRKALKSGLGPNDEELEVDFKNHLYGFLEKRVGEDTAKKKVLSRWARYLLIFFRRWTVLRSKFKKLIHTQSEKPLM